MLARSTSTRTIRGVAIGALAIAFVLLFQTRAAAQDRSLIPTEIRIAGDGTSATLTWSAVPAEGVAYRIVRRSETEKIGQDLTKPLSGTSFVDPAVTPGATYFYEVIAVFRDGTSASAEEVAFTAPAIVSPPPVVKETPRLPTEVTGITVQGTLKSAELRWQPVSGALSYTVRRFSPNAASVYSASPSITTTSWNDTGPQGMGFALAGTYTYDVIAALSGGKSVSGRGTWKRPDATCDAPPSGQSIPTSLTFGELTWIPQIPGMAGFFWTQPSNSPIMAYRIERSVPGSDTWTLIATSCAGPLGATYPAFTFLDQSGQLVPNTAYLYKVTGLIPNGDAREKTFTWTSPSSSAIQWLSSTTSGNTVTMKFRYEPPSTNAPSLPSDKFYVTSPYGLNQLVVVAGSGKPAFAPLSACWSLAGCSFVVSGVPSGTHVFTVTASWISGPTVLAKLSANTTVTIP